MFIRSQNKGRLIECNHIIIEKGEYEYNFYQKSESSVLSDFYLGSYSTKEKALKVLDMIQEQLEGVTKIFSTPVIKEMPDDFVYAAAHSMVASIQQRFPIVFQMPQDEEVK